MKDRLITFGGATLALIMVIGMFAPAPDSEEKKSVAASSDRGINGYFAARDWLQQTAVPTLALRNRYTTLSELDTSKNGNLLIVPYPQVLPIRSNEIEALKQWLEQGNQVLLAFTDQDYDIELDDFELFWSLGLEVDFTDHEADHEQAQAASQPEDLPDLIKQKANQSEIERPVFQFLADHPVLRDVSTLHIGEETDIYDKHRLSWADQAGVPITLIQDQGSQQPALLAAAGYGGRLWILRYGEVLNNNLISKADNARLFRNIIQLSVGQGGSVIFDDMHQGDSSLYNPEAFFKDSRLHISILFLLALWMLWLLGYNNRIRPPDERLKIPTQADFVRAIGHFYGRRLLNRDAADGLFKIFFNDIRRRYRHPSNGEPCWVLLEPHRSPRIDPDHLRQIKKLHHDSQQGLKIDLNKLHNLTLTIKEATA